VKGWSDERIKGPVVTDGDLDEEHLDRQVVHAEVAQPGDLG
jgi:hypothetical protein